MIFSKLIESSKGLPELTRIKRIERIRNIFKANIGKKITINYYARFESCSVNYKTTGIIKECFAIQNVIVQTKNDLEIIDIYYIIDYSFY